MSGWDKIKSVVAKAAPLLGTVLGGPAGGAAGALVAQALGVEPTPDAVEQALQSDPQAAVRLRELEMQHEADLRRMVLEAETARLAEINATMRAEAASNDAYVRRWRPTWGYMTAAAWTLEACAISWVIVASPEQAGSIAQLVGALTPQWAVALGVLGVSVVQRSRDKQTSRGMHPAGGLLSRLVGGGN